MFNTFSLWKRKEERSFKTFQNKNLKKLLLCFFPQDLHAIAKKKKTTKKNRLHISKAQS